MPENRSFQTSGIHDQLVQSQHSQTDTPDASQVDDFPALGQQIQNMRLNDNGGPDLPLYRQNVTEWQDAHSDQTIDQLSVDRLANQNRLGHPSDSSEQERRRTATDGLVSLSPRSPKGRTLGPLDAQLPASLDSNGLSWFARHGPVAASVPHTRGFGIPEQFSSQTSSPLPSMSMQPSTSLYTPNLGTSPRNTTLGRVMFERRASAINDRADDHHDLVFEEDFVPSSLNELLTPAERQRRDSRGNDEVVSKSPTGSASGSPSSSRFGLLFSKHKAAAETGMRNSPGSQGGILPIGSPLARNSGSAMIDSPLSPPRMVRNASNLRTDMKASAKEFNIGNIGTGAGNKEKDFKSEDEPFEMDI